MTDTEKALFATCRILGMALWRLRSELDGLEPPVPMDRVVQFGEALTIADNANKKWLEVQGDARVSAIAETFK